MPHYDDLLPEDVTPLPPPEVCPVCGLPVDDEGWCCMCEDFTGDLEECDG